jgi:long-chain acyl-CoA synthetase
MIAEPQSSPSAGTGTVVRMFQRRVARTPLGVAARFKEDGCWQVLTWGELAERVARVAHALLSAGVQTGDRVCLMGETRLDWVIADLGIQSAGAVTVPIYQSNLPDDCAWIAGNSGAVLAFVDSAKQAAKLAAVRESIPTVRQVVQYGGEVEITGDGWIRPIESFWPLADAFAAEHPDALTKSAEAIAAQDVSTIIYTSGTTGRPKGVMLTHDSFVFEAEATESMAEISSLDVMLLFLPLAHSFAQVLKALWIEIGFVMAFAESLEKLVDNMGEVHPTILPSVPRVFEKAYSKVISDGAATPGIKGVLFRQTMKEIEAFTQAQEAGQEYRSLALLAGEAVVLPTIREKLLARFGGRIRFFISGGAPLSRRIGWFFHVVGFQILEGFGLTETCAASTVNRLAKNKIGTVGPPLPGVQVKIASDGEILLRGRGVMKGYYRNPEATAEVLQSDGWFHTGDIGQLDSDGYLRVTDRKKDIIVTSGGKNVAPQNIENALKASPIISQVLVHGDRRKYLSALVTVSEERARQVAAARGLQAMDYAALALRPEIRSEVQAAVDLVNANLPSYETIKKFTILPNDFSQETGELTPTLKVKRKACQEKYRRELNDMYGEEGD